MILKCDKTTPDEPSGCRSAIAPSSRGNLCPSTNNGQTALEMMRGKLTTMFSMLPTNLFGFRNFSRSICSDCTRFIAFDLLYQPWTFGLCRERSDMPSSVTWHNLLDNVEELPSDATLVTPLSRNPFRVKNVQEFRILITFRDDDGTTPLQRDQFETLFQRVEDTRQGFDLDRLPPDAEPYATVMSLHPRFELDDREGTLTETGTPTSSPLVEAHEVNTEKGQREEPDIPVYGDSLLLIDALERHDPTDLEGMETPTLVNFYTLLSDVQRNANDLRQDVRSVLLDRLHHDQPVSGQYGSVQRTSRRNRSLPDEEEVLEKLEVAGINREQVTSVDPSKVDEALDVTELAESDVYEIEESEYVRKAEVDEAEKETRLQGLKDQLAATDEDTDELQQEIEELEQRIDDLTSFDSASSFHPKSEGKS